MLNSKWFLITTILAVTLCHGFAAADTPNVVYILADDMGIGDVSSLNANSKIPTPNIDRLTKEGMYFTDVHSGSGICTPTRYGILTGRYSWRTRMKRGVLWGYSPALISPERLTIASLMKKRGYNTAAIGKWHLGMDMSTNDGLGVFARGANPDTRMFTGDIDWSKPIQNGPTALGFDYFFGISASLDMDPYIYIENDRFVGECTTTKDYTGGSKPGQAHKDFEAIEVLPQIAAHTVDYIESQEKHTPFFVYMPLTAPHIPLVPADEFKGKSPLGTYGDFVLQVDHVVGQVLDAIDRKGFTKETLVIFAADNGGAHYIGAAGMEKKGHFTNLDYRGYKADIFEGGHRIPFIARWPEQVQPGTRSDETLCLTDLLATLANITETELTHFEAEDSVSFLPALLGKTLQKPLREAVVHHSGQGTFAIRQGKWKLVLDGGSGGWSSPTIQQAQIEGLPHIQLYNLEDDVAETTNVYEENPDVVSKLTALLLKYKAEGRSITLPRWNYDSIDAGV